MKTLETNFTSDNHNFTQVDRNDKAAIYKKETLEGTFVSYDVFFIKSKGDTEVYPNHTATVQGWCFSPVSKDRAMTWFERMSAGDVPCPDVDPETGEQNRSGDDITEVSLEETTPTVEPILETVDVSDPTSPTVEIPTVNVEIPTVDISDEGTALVTVAKVKKNDVVFTIPVGEFNQAEFAIANNLPVRGVVWSVLDKLVKSGKLNKSFRKTGKGRAAQVFTENKG